MSAYKIGVIGLGDISDVYINNLKKYSDIVEVTAVAARRLEAAQAKAKQHGIAKAYANGHELIADSDIDIILNLTIPAVHTEFNLAALEAGKHLYTEKPLGATFTEGQQIMRLAEDRGLRVASAPDTFLGGRLQTIRRLIDDGTLGDIVGAGAFVVSHGHEWFHPGPDFFYQPGGGPVHDIGPYYFIALLSLLGPVEQVSGMVSRTFPTRTIQTEPLKGKSIEVNVDTHVAGTLRFANGAIVSVIASFDVWDSELPRFELWGSKGTVCMDDIDPVDGPNLFGGEVLLRTVDEYRWKGLPRQQPFAEWRSVEIEHQFNELSHRENSRGIGLVDLAYAIRDNRPERASGAMALHALEVMDLLIESSSRGELMKPTTSFERPAPLPVDFPEHLQ